MWSDLPKLCTIWKCLETFKVLNWFMPNVEPTLAICYAIGQFFVGINGQKCCKNNLAIWSNYCVNMAINCLFGKSFFKQESRRFFQGRWAHFLIIQFSHEPTWMQLSSKFQFDQNVLGDLGWKLNLIIHKTKGYLFQTFINWVLELIKVWLK